MTRSRLAVLCVVLPCLTLLVACKKPADPNAIPVAEVKARADKFEPVLEILKHLPASPPSTKGLQIPQDCYLSTKHTPGEFPVPVVPYLIIHAEDLTVPSFYAESAVQVRISNSGVGGCVSGLQKFKDNKEPTISKYVLAGCEGYKYAFVIKTVEYVAPKISGGSDTTEGNTRTIVENFTPGHVTGDVTIYELSGGKPVGEFRFRADSSSKPSMEGGFDGALHRDLARNADVAIEEAFSAARRGATTPATAPHKPKK
jgi:hypothetical protein